MTVVGIEGTAWAASAAAYDPDGSGFDPGAVSIETDAYQPESGGLHPREAAEHMRDRLPAVIETVLDRIADESQSGDPAAAIDAVAFSRGPGLGPCLRTAGSAARALAGTLGVPLVGVNHMLAHAEIGRRSAGFDDPVCLNASGANAHVLVERGGRYRVLGETLDTGVGNALDKVARHVGWSHPGGPKIERAARDGTYVELPYVVKGLDLSFAGLASAAQERYDAGTSVEDVCFALQEHAFASLAEVAERALALTRRDELVLGGGVGANDRLREMLAVLCDRRGASFHAPEPRFLRDNAGMIAVLGAAMHAAGDTVPVADSRVRPDWRPDEPAVTWRSSADRGPVQPPADEPIAGAEAAVSVTGDRVRKRRTRRAYRAPALDDRVRRRRTGSEARLTSAARRAGVPTPVVLDVNPYESEIVTGRVGDADLADAPSDERMGTVAEHLARLHAAGIVHGDPTTRNVRAGDRTWLIDFGLAYHSEASEDRAMDLHVLRRSLAGTVDDGERYGRLAVEAYATAADGTGVDTDAVRARLAEIEGRGRYAGSDAA